MMRRRCGWILGALLLASVLGGCAHSQAANEEIEAGLGPVQDSMELEYASQFSVDYYRDGLTMIQIENSGSYLVVPEGGQVPEELPEGVTVICQPLDHIYLAATSAMDFFRSLDGISQVTLSGAEASDWYIQEARDAMEADQMVYAGKYRTPDYELILSENCDLAIESTMIEHTPEVKEELETLGIPVLVERSSYESHPLGRMEWIKVYGALLGKEDQAEAEFQERVKQVQEIVPEQPSGKSVAFFYLNAKGYANVRKPGDYIPKMIEMAGGVYLPQQQASEDNALSTMHMEMEAFYAQVKDADYIIYNSTIDEELETLDQLVEKSSLMADFKAVREGNVWCTGKNMFQETMGAADLILDIHRILTEDTPDPDKMVYLDPVL